MSTLYRAVLSVLLGFGLCDQSAIAQIYPPTTGATQAGCFIGPADLQTLSTDTIGGPWMHLLYLKSFTEPADRPGAGSLQLAVDPILDIRAGTGFDNVRGARWAGRIDDRIDFGGTLLEMQRQPAGPPADWTALHGGYPGMGRGKISTDQDGLLNIDHSQSSAWFKFDASKRVEIQWGLGSQRIGPAIYNALLSDEVAPAPYLQLAWDLTPRWTLHYLQRRLQGLERLPADGVREGRYAPMGLAVRAISYAYAPQTGPALSVTAMTGRLFKTQERSTAECIADLGFWPQLADKRSDHWNGINAQVSWTSGLAMYGQVAHSPQHHRLVFGTAYSNEHWNLWVEGNSGKGAIAQTVEPPMGAGPARWWNASDSLFTRSQIAGIAWHQGRWSASAELTRATSRIGVTAQINWMPWDHAPFQMTAIAASWNEESWWSVGLSSHISHGRKTY